MASNIIPDSPRTIFVVGQIEAALSVKPLTMVEIADAINMTLKSAQTYMNYLRTAGQAHVKEYRVFKTTHFAVRKTPVYAYGPGVDAPVPKKAADVAHEKYLENLGFEKPAPVEEFIPRCDWAAAWVPNYAKASVSGETA